MSKNETIYDLKIISALDLPFTKRGHLPDAFVKISVTGFDYETKVIKRNRDPQWNEETRFTAQSRSSMIAIDVRHSSFAFVTTSIGTVRAEIGDLVDRCNNKEVELALNLEKNTSVNEGKSRIRILLSVPESTKAAEAAIVDARMDANAIDSSKNETMVGYGEGALALANKATNLSALSVVLDKIDIFVKIADKTASVHPYATLAWGIVSSVYKIVRNQITTDYKLIALVGAMESVYLFVDAIQSNVAEKVKVLEDTIEGIFAQTIECSIFIREYHRQGGFAGRTLHGLVKDNAGTIDKLTQGLLNLKKDFDSDVTIQTAIVSFRIQEDVSKMLKKQILQDLAPADMEASLIKGCLPSTRQNVLSEIFGWATDTSDQNVFWLHGFAGSGKTTISITVANYFRDIGRLGSFIFFDRNFPQRSHPSKVIRTLAYKLGEFDPRFGTVISAAIESHPSIKDASLSVQFTRLIINPLASLSGVQTGGPIMLVFDALDECGNSAERETLLKVLGEMLTRLPFTIRVLVTSRPLEDISVAFEGKANIRAFNLEVSSEIGRRDIVAYFKHHLGVIQRKKLPRQPDWPGDEAIQNLGRRSYGLFIWASTVVKFIDQFNPAKCLCIILQGAAAPGAQSALDILYTTALEEAYSWVDIEFIESFRTVLEAILVLQNPLATSTLDQLIGLPEDVSSTKIVSPLACLIANDPTLHLLHPSFADFLFSRERCGKDIWYFDTATCHRQFTLKCLSRLSNGGLKRNMFNLTLSAAPEDKKVPSDIAYACMFWITHICSTSNDDLSLVGDLELFLKTHLLHWFEVMSILGKSRETVVLLGNLHRWITLKFPDQHNLVKFVRDAWQFAQAYGTFMEEHPLLVYFGALPFTPTTSVIYQTFHDPRTCPTISGGFPDTWSSAQLVLSHTSTPGTVAFSPNGAYIVTGSGDQIHFWDAASGIEVLPLPPLSEHEILSVAFSPDGTRFVCGSTDSIVCIWDAMSRTKVGILLRGHALAVTSIAFSRDGTRIVSGSDDKTVRVWDAFSGTEVFPPLLGHEDSVRSVAFSPDGTRIISGSYDETVRVWDATSSTELHILRQPEHQPAASVAFSPDGTRIVSISGHSIRVWDAVSGTEIDTPFGDSRNNPWFSSVAFSPDGTRIVSGSQDGTVCVWDAMTGSEMASLRRRHHSGIVSVVFSPDGARIASGSQDLTVCVWDASNSTESEAFRGHASTVEAVAFSADGKRVVSGSWDKTVRIWDAVSGSEAVPPFRGHWHWIYSVAFSPDGTRIVSGSHDNSARVWDVVTGAEMVVLQGEDYEVYKAVAFSPDGTRVVSGSDSTVRVWDPESGAQIMAFEGHGDWVTSVAYSPDGGRIVSGSRDKTVRVWDILSETTVFPPLQGHESSLESVIFSSDGTHIISTSSDTTYIWDSATGLPYMPDVQNQHNNSVPSRIVLYADGRIVDIYRQRTICKVPRVVAYNCSATSGNSLCIGSNAGRVLILNFSEALLNALETRPVGANSVQ